MTAVLVVDDEPDIRLLTGIILEMEGHEVLRASTGEEALEVLASNDVDLILLDIRLPGIDGWEVLERVKASPQTSHIPVVMMSAHASGHTRRRALTSGCRAYLSKPFGQEELARMVDAIAKG